MQLVMPELSPGLESCTLVRWLVGEGAAVEAGQPLAELESDKAATEFVAPAKGVLLKRLVADGAERIQVGSLIAELQIDGENPSTSALIPIETREPAPARTRIKASPVARRLARSGHIELSDLQGTGPGGRIVQSDVLRALQPRRDIAGPSPMEGREDPGRTPHQVRRLTAMRDAIARNVSASKREVPHFYLSLDVDTGALMELRRELVDSKQKVSVNDLVVRACALSLRAVPLAHVQFAGDKLLLFERADISVAIAIDAGLVTPVLHGVDQLDIFEIARRVQNLSERARSGGLRPEEMSGGTFTVSNLGMFGIGFVLPIINSPQCGILGVGEAQERPVVRNGRVEVGKVMTLVGSFDHRALDGATGAAFMAALKGYLEHPLQLVLPFGVSKP